MTIRWLSSLMFLRQQIVEQQQEQTIYQKKYVNEIDNNNCKILNQQLMPFKMTAITHTHFFFEFALLFPICSFVVTFYISCSLHIQKCTKLQIIISVFICPSARTIATQIVAHFTVMTF